MKIPHIKETVPLPEGVTVSLDGTLVTVKGEKGEVSRTLASKQVTITPGAGEVVVEAKNVTRREKKLLYTFIAHVKNMARGVTEGHVYKLKICSGHFPMNVSLKGNVFEIKNFIGESVPRTMPVIEGVEVKIDGDIITVSGIDKESVAQVAGRIETLTKRPGFDNRIFQDGIYLTEKDGKVL